MARSRQEVISRRDRSSSYRIIKQMAGRYPVSLLCRLATVSKSGYYKWVHRQDHPTEKDLNDEAIKAKILYCYRKVKGIYGYRRIKVSLQKQFGLVANHKIA